MENKGERKGRSKTVMINSMGGGYNQLLFPGHGLELLSVGDSDCSRNKLGRTQTFCSKAYGNGMEIPETASCERDQQGLEHGQMDRSVLQPRRWQAEPAAMSKEKLQAQKADRHGFTWLQTGDGTHLNLYKHEQDCSWEEKARFKERKGW